MERLTGWIEDINNGCVTGWYQSLNDSGVFLSSVVNYKKFDDRIGHKPFLLEQPKIKSVDIDWPDDFIFAEELWRKA